MVGEPKYVPAELYWFLNELLKKTKNDVVIAGWKALFGKDLNPTQIRYLKNKYGNDDVYNAPLSNKRLAYKWPEEAHQLCPGYKRDHRPDAGTAEAHRLLAEKLLPYGVEANLCPDYPSTDYMRKVESEGTPYHGPQLPEGSITFGRALKDGPPAPDRGRQQSDAGPSSTTARPGLEYMSRSQPGSSRMAVASRLSPSARPGSSSNPHPSIENVRAVPSARSGVRHETTQHNLSTLNAPLGSGFGQEQRPQFAASQRAPAVDRGQQIGQVDPRLYQQQQASHAQQAPGGMCQLTQAQYQQILAARAARNAGVAGMAQGQQTVQDGQQLSQAQFIQLRAQQSQGAQEGQQAGPIRRFPAQQNQRGFVQGQLSVPQQAQQRSLATPYPLMQVSEGGAVLVESDGHLIWSPSHVFGQSLNRGPASVAEQAAARIPGAPTAGQPTRQLSGMGLGDEGEASIPAQRKRRLSLEMEETTSKRMKVEFTDEAHDDSVPATALNLEPSRPDAVPRDPNTLHPLPDERPRTGVLEPTRQDRPRSTDVAGPAREENARATTPVAAVTEYVDQMRVSTSPKPQSATTPQPAPQSSIKREQSPESGSDASIDSTSSPPTPA